MKDSTILGELLALRRLAQQHDEEELRAAMHATGKCRENAASAYDALERAEVRMTEVLSQTHFCPDSLVLAGYSIETAAGSMHEQAAALREAEAVEAEAGARWRAGHTLIERMDARRRAALRSEQDAADHRAAEDHSALRVARDAGT